MMWEGERAAGTKSAPARHGNGWSGFDRNKSTKRRVDSWTRWVRKLGRSGRLSASPLTGPFRTPLSPRCTSMWRRRRRSCTPIWSHWCVRSTSTTGGPWMRKWTHASCLRQTSCTSRSAPPSHAAPEPSVGVPPCCSSLKYSSGCCERTARPCCSGCPRLPMDRPTSCLPMWAQSGTSACLRTRRRWWGTSCTPQSSAEKRWKPWGLRCRRTSSLRSRTRWT
mmetsp:Transcript_21355/g.36375  ORF Transcript_21355/g.36375 Transcript_21355/m.36375 type:complete len:222 (+) Transcript_21355:1062-1727(+)